jgi:hypothetical protein
MPDYKDVRIKIAQKKRGYQLVKTSTIVSAKELVELEEKFNKELNAFKPNLASYVPRYDKIRMMMQDNGYKELRRYKNVEYIARMINAYYKKTSANNVTEYGRLDLDINDK